MSDIKMIELSGCAKPRQFDYKVQQCREPEMLIKAAEQYGLAVDAGQHGVVEIWRDDNNQYRCQFTSYEVVDPDSVHIGDLEAAKNWLEKWWPLQHEFC